MPPDPTRPPAPSELDENGLAPGDPGYSGPAGKAAPIPRLRVPGNLVPVIEAVSQQTGAPFEIIAGIIQTNHASGTSGDWSMGILPSVVAGVGSQLRKYADQEANMGNPSDWRVIARDVFGRGAASWQERFDSIVYPKVNGKYQYDKAQWIEREPTQYPEGTTVINVPNVGGGVGGFRINLGGTDKKLSREDWAILYRRGQISRGQFENALRGIGYDDNEIEMVISIESSTGVGPKPVDIADVYYAFERLTGRTPSQEEAARYVGMTPDAMRASMLTLPEAASWLQNGTKIQETRRWMDRTWFDLYGRAPSNDEVLGVIKGGYTPETLERWARQQPVNGTTRGEMADLRKISDQQAKEILGRDADEAELSWLIGNLSVRDASGKILRGPSVDQVSAFYEQLKQRLQTGDPAFLWVADPETWRRTQSQIQATWTKAGLVGQPDPRMVNDALQKGWTAADIQDHINALPAPGFPAPITVGEVGRVREIASEWKSKYLPGTPLTKEEVQHFVALSSDEVRRYYRCLPVSLHRQAVLNARTAIAEKPAPQAQPTWQPTMPPATANPVPRSAEEALKMGQPWGGGGVPVSREGYRVEPREPRVRESN